MPFGRHAQGEALVPVEPGDGLAHEALVSRAVEGDSAHVPQEPAERSPEERVLAEEGKVELQHGGGAEQEEAVPIGGVGRGEDHVLLQAWRLTDALPAQQAIDDPSHQGRPGATPSDFSVSGSRPRVSFTDHVHLKKPNPLTSKNLLPRL